MSSLQERSPWPVPMGEVPVLWGPAAFAKLCLQFLRAFEGDLVLGHGSFLADERRALPFAFRIADIPDRDALPWDHEGAAVQPLNVFNKGRARGLACSRAIADALHVPPTGHARRENYQSAPTPGFWRPYVEGDAVCDHLLAEVPWGLSVEEVDVLHFDPESGDLRLRLRRLRLVHHGEMGESVESVEWEGNLLNLLASCRLFSKTRENFGFHVVKNHQRFLTEISVPSALSETVSIAGSVPTSHYW